MKPLIQCRWAALALLASVLGAPAQDIAVAPPARNWTLPLFTKEGYRQMTLRGDEVHPITANQINIKGMTVTVYSGGPDAKVDSVLTSPEATFLISEKIASGTKSVHVIRDDVDVTGEGWTFRYDDKKVLISKHAHVVFHSALPDMLK